MRKETQNSFFGKKGKKNAINDKRKEEVCLTRGKIRYKVHLTLAREKVKGREQKDGSQKRWFSLSLCRGVGEFGAN